MHASEDALMASAPLECRRALFIHSRMNYAKLLHNYGDFRNALAVLDGILAAVHSVDSLPQTLQDQDRPPRFGDYLPRPAFTAPDVDRVRFLRAMLLAEMQGM